MAGRQRGALSGRCGRWADSQAGVAGGQIVRQVWQVGYFGHQYRRGPSVKERAGGVYPEFNEPEHPGNNNNTAAGNNNTAAGNNTAATAAGNNNKAAATAAGNNNNTAAAGNHNSNTAAGNNNNTALHTAGWVQ